MYKDYLQHEGNENSGRYPRGSGDRPYQHTGNGFSKRDIRDANIKDLKTIVNDINSGSKSTLDPLIELAKQNKKRKTNRIDLNNLSNEELSKFIKRYNLEKKYKEIISETTPSASDKLQAFLNVVGPISSLAITGLTIAQLLNAGKQTK